MSKSYHLSISLHLLITTVIITLADSKFDEFKLIKNAKTCSLELPNQFGPSLNFTTILTGFDKAKNVTIPKITDDSSVPHSNRSLILSFCSGLNKQKIYCGLDTSQVTACVYDPPKTKNEGQLKLTKQNSSIIANVNNTSFNYVREPNKQPEIYWLGTLNKPSNGTLNKPSNGTELAALPSIKVSFVCLPEKSTKTDYPKFVNYNNSTYNFEWAFKEICQYKTNLIESMINNGTSINIETSPKPKTTPHQTDHLVDDAKSTPVPGSKKHENTMNETITIEKTTTQTPKKSETKVQPTSANNDDNKPRMNTIHKVFMTGLIILSLVGFVIGLLILDKKTQLRIPLGNLASRNRLNRRSVPYNRMSDNLGNGLDL